MKTQLESVTRQFNRSFSMMFNPNLSDLYFWHFHPEYELVFIDQADGTRQVGDHISNYKGCDLVLIGSNIPHLNFDYGLKNEYQKVVVHLKKEFVESTIPAIPELKPLQKLFDRSRFGIAFNSQQRMVGRSLFELEGKSPFQQYLLLTDILNEISKIANYTLLHDAPYHNVQSDKEHLRLQSIYAFVDHNYHRKIELKEAAAVANMTKEAFCRYFKKASKYTFVEFLNRYRISQSKAILIAGASISDACFQSGFESLSYYNRIFKRVTNENPSTFQKRYL
ncbi:MAG: AraC family transcriptional regulator [Bacteroidota bacterium]